MGDRGNLAVPGGGNRCLCAGREADWARLAFTLLLATTLLGVLVLRRVGYGAVEGLGVAVRDPEARVKVAPGIALTAIGGVLLVLPGFLTDLIGLSLLLAPVRRWCGTALRRAMQRGERTTTSVVDLAPDEWHREPDPKL